MVSNISRYCSHKKYLGPKKRVVEGSPFYAISVVRKMGVSAYYNSPATSIGRDPILRSRKNASSQINLSGQKGVVSMHRVRADNFIWNDAIFFLERRKYYSDRMDRRRGFEVLSSLFFFEQAP